MESGINVLAMENQVAPIQKHAPEAAKSYSLEHIRRRIRKYIILFGALSVVCILGMAPCVVYFAMHIASIRRDIFKLNTVGFAIMIILNVSSFYTTLRRFDFAAAFLGLTDGVVCAILCLALITCNMVYKEEFTINEDIKPILYEVLHAHVALCALNLAFKIYQSVAIATFSEYKNRKKGNRTPEDISKIALKSETITISPEDDVQGENL